MDAHCHTDCSDGSITIEERIVMIRKLGYEAAVITDHDFVSAEQVRRAKAAAGDMPFIPAAEFSAAYQGETVHVLGYFLDVNNQTMQAHFSKVQDEDRRVSERMLAKFKDLGAAFDVEDLQSQSLHTFYSMQLVKRIAINLYGNDPARTMHAFLEIMRTLNLRYADYAPWPVEEVIRIIHQAGGIAVLAHPGGKDDAMMRSLNFCLHDQVIIERYLNWGLDGIETRTPVHTSDEIEYYEAIADRLGLLKTAGSDCHGDDDYLGPALMGTFNNVFQDGYERIHDRWKERFQ